MKSLVNRLLKSFNISGRDLAVFLLALLLAFSMWLIHNLSLRYNDYLTTSVIAQCNIEGHTNQSLNSTDVIARCRATGYQVILSGIRSGRSSVNVTFDQSVMRYKGDDLYYVLASDLTEYAHIIYGEGVSLEYFVSDTLYFRFPEVEYKKVPVQPAYSISYMPQYMSKGDIHIIPDSVTLYGNAYRLESIDKVITEPIKHNSVSSGIQGIIPLESIDGVRMSVSEVHYLLDVSRFVGMSLTLPVSVVNVPADKRLVPFPSRVDASLKMSFPLEGDLEELEVKVDYNDYVNSLSGVCPLRLEGETKGLISYDLDPVAVNCVLEDK